MGGIEVIFWLSVIETGLAGLVVWASGEAFFPQALSGFLMPFLLAIFVQVLGQGLIVTGLGQTDIAVAGVLALMQPVVAALVSWRVFGEALTAVQLGGAALILLAVWLAQRRKTS
jgi:drug/metabolite transporter (DMT)-like permease